MKRLLLALLCAGTGACATMDETACRNANWSELGKADGLAGNQPWIDQYAYQCSRYNVAAARSDYMDGWWLGNDEYSRRNPGPDSP